MQHDHILKKLILFLYGGFLAPGAEFEKKSYLDLWRPFFQQSGTICAILVKGIIRNNSVKLYSIWTSGSRENVIKRHYLSKALTAPLFGGAKPFVQRVVEGIIRNNSVKLF